jgi:hypothetical protein
MVVVLTVLAICPVWGQTIDPAALHIGPGFGTPCATGCAGNPNSITGSTLDIYQSSGGAAQLVFLVIGIPNDTTNLFTSVPINDVTFINGGISTAGSVAGGFVGSLTSSDIYTLLHISQLVGLNSFANWSSTDLSRLGITVHSFGIYVFALTSGANLGPHGFVNVTFSSPLPAGSYAVAYGLNTNGSIYGTPFSEAGLVVPEPASLALFGLGMIGLAVLVRRRSSAS